VRPNKKLTVIGSLAIITTICAAATLPQQNETRYQNLKVLPQNISSKDLNKIMVDDFEDGLGVACSFCHAQKSGTDNLELDFASDAKPEKQIARVMMRMTLGLNSKYLKVKHPALGSPSLVVSCETCHRGEAFPGDGPK